MDFEARRHSAVATKKAAVRKILIVLGILIALVIVVVASWIFAGRQISLFVDRFVTIEVSSARISSIVYEGRGTGGTIHVNDLALSLNDRNDPSPNIGTTKDDQLGLAVFPVLWSNRHQMPEYP